LAENWASKTPLRQFSQYFANFCTLAASHYRYGSGECLT
jgi:hypothetical protein